MDKGHLGGDNNEKSFFTARILPCLGEGAAMVALMLIIGKLFHWY